MMSFLNDFLTFWNIDIVKCYKKVYNNIEDVQKLPKTVRWGALLYVNLTDIEIIKNLLYIHSCNKIQTDGINLIVTVKNQEDKIEAESEEDLKELEKLEKISGLTKEQVKTLVIAYEPIWAIGTGKTASSEDANEVCTWIREEIQNLFGDVSKDVIIQYGGSVKSSNAKELFNMSDIDGGLVGGASLIAEEFAKIVNYNV